MFLPSCKSKDAQPLRCVGSSGPKSGQPFDEQGLEAALLANRREGVSDIGTAVVRAVEQHTADTRLADDLTILLLRRAAVATGPTAVGV